MKRQNLVTKRQKFVVSSLLLSLGFVLMVATQGQSGFLGIGLLTLLTVVLFYWSLMEGIGKNATAIVLVLPTLFTLGVGLFWFLLPSGLFTRLPVAVLYGAGVYALLLTSNILTVSAIRTIALLRAAKGVGFVLTLFTSFLLYDAVLSLRAAQWTNALLIFAISILLSLQALWVSKLGYQLSMGIVRYSLVFSYALALVGIFLYFWPVTVVVGSLFLTVSLYLLLGLGQAQVEGRLFRQTSREYLLVGAAVFVAMFFATHWRV